MPDDVVKALQSIGELPQDEKRVGTCVGEAAITCAENRLGIHLPEPYRVFLSAYGWGGPDETEIFGLSETLPDSELPELVRKNLEARTDDDLPHTLLAFATTGDGGYYVLDVMSGSDGAVHVWYRKSDIEYLERSDESFGEWLSRAVEDTILLRDT